MIPLSWGALCAGAGDEESTEAGSGGVPAPTKYPVVMVQPDDAVDFGIEEARQPEEGGAAPVSRPAGGRRPPSR